MDREILSFRDKVGKILMSLGLGFLLFSLFVIASFSWIYKPDVVPLLFGLALLGVALMMLSTYTVKK